MKAASPCRRFRLIRPLAALLAGLVLPPLVLAQGTAKDSLRNALESARQRMHAADSGGTWAERFDATMELAPLAPAREGVALLGLAVRYADSLQRPDLGAMASRLLAARAAAMGQFEAAYAAQLVSDSLDGQREWNELEEQDSLVQAQLAERDSLLAQGQARELGMARAIAALQENVHTWAYAAGALLLLGLALVLGLLYRAGRATTRMQATIDALRTELAAMKERPPTDAKGAVKKEEVQAGHAVDEAMKPVVAGMFGKGAPERLATLREARRRGDTDKIVRVVASLKPLLLNFNAPRFGPLITRLKAPAAAADQLQWNKDLDELEAGVVDLLEGGPLH